MSFWVVACIPYILSGVFFALISGKCFFDKLNIPKMLCAFLLSPAIGQGVTFIIGEKAIDFSENSKKGTLMYALVTVGIQLILQMIMMFLYIKLVKANTSAISMFVYLCSIQLIPNSAILTIAQLISNTKYFWGGFLFLHVMFYFLAVVPISKYKNKKASTDTKLLIILPILTYIFNTIITARTYFTMYYEEDILREFIRIDYDKLLSVVDKEHFENVLIDLENSSITNLGFLVYPCMFIIAVLIIAFYIIVRNIEYRNNAIKAHDEVKALSVEVMEALAHTIDAKDEYTRGHSVRVAKYSKMIAEKMGLTDKQCEDIYYMGLLHDIGKIGVPNEIINKPSRLTDEEYDVIKTHPLTGFEILSEIKSRPDLATGARWHHERYDGTGYPDHKTGEDIPLEARIIAVADSYDAMTSNRSYRNYLPQDKVRKEIEKNAGTQFDEVSAKYMLAIIDEDTDYVLHE